jgi:hypothetical protein
LALGGAIFYQFRKIPLCELADQFRSMIKNSRREAVPHSLFCLFSSSVLRFRATSDQRRNTIAASGNNKAFFMEQRLKAQNPDHKKNART